MKYILALLFLAITSITVTDQDVERFQASHYIVIGYNQPNKDRLVKDIDKFKNELKFEFEKYDYEEGWCSWKVKVTKDNLQKIHDTFERVVPGGIKVR